MKSFTNINVNSFQEAVSAAQQARNAGQIVAFSGGGTDLLQQIKDGTNLADVIINLRNIDTTQGISANSAAGLTSVQFSSGVNAYTRRDAGLTINGQVTLEELSTDAAITAGFPLLAEAAVSVGTPQIRNLATLAGNVTQRPWCWYYRNGFNCFKAGGDECFSVNGENQQHAIFGGGPSFIVHPSDLAPALVALNASFNIVGPDGERTLSADEFFLLPSQDPRRENALADGELLGSIDLPGMLGTSVGTYYKVMDREAWTHAEVSVAVVLTMIGENIELASVVLGGVATIPWKLLEVESFLAGKPLTEAVAREAGELAIASAQPLAKNGHKLPMTSAAVERTLLSLAGA